MITHYLTLRTDLITSTSSSLLISKNLLLTFSHSHSDLCYTGVNSLGYHQLKCVSIKPLGVGQIRSDQSLSRVRLFATPWIAARQASLSITNSGIHSGSHPSSQWCHPAISSSVVPFFSCPQSLPASESFPMSQLFTWGGQSTVVSALASFLPKKSQGWS